MDHSNSFSRILAVANLEQRRWSYKCLHKNSIRQALRFTVSFRALRDAWYFIICITRANKDETIRWQVVDALVFHFLRFRNTDPASVTEADVMKMGERAATQAKLPVIWHQTREFQT